ncbi:MAG: signal peptidase I [Clostridia bacterium]|nr:signal peptidase I [Clostridia bacterium]
MTETITYGKSLYDKYRRNIKADILFGIIASVLLTFVLAAVLISTFVLVKVVIKGPSMNPTLFEGEVVVVNTYREPTYGEIIVISGEKSNDWLIKRAIALGGDTVKIEGGYVYLKKSGETDYTKLYEPYLYRQGITFYPTVNDERDIAPTVFKVGEDEIFYLGDNRMNSSDSRSRFGTCTTAQVVGVVSEFALKTKGINTFFANAVATINGLFS